MNLMFLIDDKLITAELGDTMLNGITRDSVLTLAREWGVEVEERKVEIAEIIDAIESGRMQEAFGAGTAATIAQISTIGYNGKDYELPPVEGREFSHRVLRTLDDIRYGRTEDKFGWLHTL